MGLWTMIVAIVGIVVVGDILKRIFDVKKTAGANSNDVQRLIAINEELNGQVKTLEKRVATLETIVTQEGYDLKQTINSL
ncbi:hypothetical protein ACMAZF_09045 [Psychrobium sp. nBUS_13]|uniref:hypothetical protein n=1 Tax=Psychrobium sp. nBUS_13 TaxID=3395319 RepID=UPI0009128C50|nr:MAG: hypothetical protein BM565_02005 [Gammaproteobacteria bacterium MedPE]|tara:strand:+ start:369 stop:608 length:240 start_codon:yes stop_codon:yes gene_type:complete